VSESVASGNKAPAGIVADAYVDGVLEALEREMDLIPERQEVYEGKELTRDELELFRAFASQIRVELDRRACPLGFRIPRVDPECMGKGFRFYWTKASGAGGYVDYHYDDMVRLMRNGEQTAKFGETIGREMIKGLLGALVREVQS